MIGLFDSGLGGLTVVRRMHEVLPSHDLLFFADQAHMPYGDREPADLHRLLRENLEWLNAAGADVIAAACNTSCAVAARYGWPQSRAVVLDLIESAAIAVEQGGFRRIGVVATTATARSGAYAQRIGERVEGAQVFEVAAPALVPLVEAGKLHGEEPLASVREVCARLPRDLDAVVYACTHYPMLDANFVSVLPAGVARIDPAIAQAGRAAELVRRSGIAEGSGTIRCVTNGDLEQFTANVRAILGDAAKVTTQRQTPAAA